MYKKDFIVYAYQLATLTYPTDEIIDLLLPLSDMRILELCLVIRQSTTKIKSPLNYMKRAIEEDWSPTAIPVPINRKSQNIEQRFYENRGYSPEEARQKAYERNKVSNYAV